MHCIIHALRILRSHGLLDDSIYVIYRAVVIAKLTYAVDTLRTRGDSVIHMFTHRQTVRYGDSKDLD